MRIFAEGMLAEEIGQASVTAAQKAGAEALVTACPFCEINLDASSKRLDYPMPVYDIIDLVSDSMGIEVNSK